MDDATRARLERDTQARMVSNPRDVEALLEAYDALLAERATPTGEILDSYPCASPTCPAEQCVLGRRITALEAERDEILRSRDHMQRLATQAAVASAAAADRIAALEAAQAQAAPVLAALDRWITKHDPGSLQALSDAHRAWRAAQEG